MSLLHVLAADGAFLPDGCFVALPPVPGSLLAQGFRRAVLEFLINNDALSEGFRSRMLGWRHCGFSAHNEVRVPTENAEGRKKLTGTMLRAPMALEQMTCDVATSDEPQKCANETRCKAADDAFSEGKADA